MRTLPAAKISPGADVEGFVDPHRDGGNYDLSCHDADRDNLMMMKMMNAPHEPIPLDDRVGWCQPLMDMDNVYEVSNISDSGSSSGGSSECSDDIVQEQTSMNNPLCEETDLREFLMETFEDTYVTEFVDDMAQLRF
jgi:hypothetical protein